MSAEAKTPTVPTARLRLGGKERVLRMDYNALMAAEDVRGKNFCRAEHLLDPSFGDRRAIIWGCLLHADPDLKLEDVGQWLHPGNHAVVQEALYELIKAFLGEPESSEGGDAPLDPEADAAA